MELYIHEVHPAVPRPPQELKGFDRLMLQCGEMQTELFTIRRRDLSFWDVATHAWRATPGMFEARIGSSSRDIRSVVKFKFTESPDASHGTEPGH